MQNLDQREHSGAPGLPATTRRWVIGASLAVPGLAALTACGSFGATAGPEAKGKRPVTLQVYMESLGSGDRISRFPGEIVEPYVASHPHVTIDPIPLPAATGTAERLEKLQLMISTGTPPDIYEISLLAEQLAALQVPESLDALAKRDRVDLKRFNQRHFEKSSMYQGKLWQLPHSYSGNTLSLAVNVELFKQAGVAIPSADVKNSWTWQQFVDALVKLTKKGPDGEIAQFGFHPTGSNTYTWPLQWEGDWISADLKTVICDSPEMQECYTRFFELPFRYHVVPRAGEANRLFGNVNLFLTGKSAVAAVPPFGLAPYVQAKTVELAFAPMPRARRSSPDVEHICTGVVKGSKQVEEAWQFVRYLTDGSRFGKFTQRVPAEVAQIDPWLRDQFKLYADPRTKVVADAIENAAPTINLVRHPKLPELSKLILQGMNVDIWEEKIAPVDFLKTVKPQLQAIIDGRA